MWVDADKAGRQTTLNGNAKTLADGNALVKWMRYGVCVCVSVC